MNLFSKILLGLIAAGETIGPIFLSTGKEHAILNAGETLAAEIIQIFATGTPPPAQASQTLAAAAKPLAAQGLQSRVVTTIGAK